MIIRFLLMSFAIVTCINLSALNALAISLSFGPATYVPYGCCKTKCCKGTGPMATPSGVALAWNWFDTTLSEQIKLLGDAVESSQNKVTSIEEESKKLSMKTIDDMIKGYSNANEKMQQTYAFGEPSETYLGSYHENIAPKTKAGQDAGEIMSAILNNEFNDFASSYSKSHELMNRYNSQEMENISTQNLSPKNDSFQNSEFKKAIINSENILHPFPTSVLPDEHKSSQSGKMYSVLSKIAKSENAISQLIISDIISSYVPMLEIGEDVQVINDEVDASGSLVEIVDNKISSMSYLQYMSDIRFGDNKWIFGPSGLSSKTKTGVVREILFLESLLLEVERIITKRLYQMNVAAAQMTSDEIRTLDSMMNKQMPDVLNSFINN